MRQRSIFAGRLASPRFDPDAAHPRSAPDHLRARHRRRLRRHADYRDPRTGRQRRDDAHRPLPFRLDRDCRRPHASARRGRDAAASRRDRSATRTDCRPGCRGLRADRHRRAHHDHRPIAPAGVFYGVQTLRQLLPPFVEHEATRADASRPVRAAAVRIADSPRFAWRGAMLDVARHFFDVDDVKRYMDLMALLQAQYPAPASVRRSGLADRDQVMAEPGGRGRQERGRRRRGRILHAAGLQRHRGLRAGTRHHHRARDRHAQPHQRRSGVVRRAQLRRRRPSAVLRHRSRVQLVVCRQGNHLQVHRRRRPRDFGADARPVLPYRR